MRWDQIYFSPSPDAARMPVCAYAHVVYSNKFMWEYSVYSRKFMYACKIYSHKFMRIYWEIFIAFIYSRKHFEHAQKMVRIIPQNICDITKLFLDGTFVM